MRLPILLLALLAVGAASGQSYPLNPSPHTTVCAIDGDGGGSRSSGEPLYLMATACGPVAAGDARLLHTADGPGGTLVRGDDRDAGRATILTSASYGCFDQDGSGSYNAHDPVYLHFGPLPGPATVGDVPLSGPQAFTALRAGDPAVNSPLVACPVQPGGETFAETGGSPGFDAGDVLYLDMDASGFPSLGDIRLAAPAASAPSSATTSSPTTTKAPPETTTAQAPSSSSPAEPSSTDATSLPTTPEANVTSAPGATSSSPPSSKAEAAGWIVLGVCLVLAIVVLRRAMR